MVYFFEKSQRYLQYEIQETDIKAVFAIVETHPDGFSRREYVTGNDELQTRWRAIERELRQNGWRGPHGRSM
jgi:hypothetical protein